MSSGRDEMDSRDYPICEDMPLQLRTWKMERLGWIVFWLLVVLALLGLFSVGPLSWIDAQTPNGDLQVKYQRFERNGASSQLELKARVEPGEQVWLVISGDLLESFTIESIQPQPTTSQSMGRGLRLQLQADAQGWATVHLTLRPDSLGLAKSMATVNDQSVSLTQFIYP